MAFDLSKITYELVIAAAKQIELENIPLHASTGFDVIVNEKRYPPKEIVRISYRLATNSDIGRLYGGKQTNSILEKLGFKVEPKIHVWKLGCNWGRQAPSFYDLIAEEQIVISTENFPFAVGDLVLITEGFTVYAIAKVTGSLQPVTENEKFEELFEPYDIDYIDTVKYATAEWYELPETEYFTYELIQGIRRIQKRDIIDKTIDIWENKDTLAVLISFHNRTGKHAPDDSWFYPAVVFEKENWNDYGYVTSFNLYIYKSATEKTSIGHIKILDKHNTNTELSDEFQQLSNGFCSLGQTLDFYKRLKSELPDQYEDVLRRLNDCAFYDEIREAFQEEQGFRSSLLRTSEAELALREAKAVVQGGLSSDRYQFEFSVRIGNALEDHRVEFEFNLKRELPNRFFCIIGKNGTGKTKFISQLANKLSDDNAEGSFRNQRPKFSKVIAASFSYFDKFREVQAEDISYEFIGVKGTNGIMNEAEIESIIWMAFKKISDKREKKDLWMRSIKESLEVEYLDFALEELINIPKREEFRKRTEDIFSSGQKIVFQFLTRFLAIVENNSLLIFDEPETHLHPNIAGRLLRTINNILKECRSYCILSTHSPIIVQEMPSQFIRIFDRRDNRPSIYRPRIECFGENLSNISNSIFQAEQENEIYKEVFGKLSSTHKLEQIDALFENKLSLNARLFIQTIKDINNHA